MGYKHMVAKLKVGKLPILVGLLLLTLNIFSQAAAETAKAYEFQMPSQSLLKSLSTFTEITGIPVLMPGDRSLNVIAPAISGAMTADEAMQQLLQGTGLTTRVDDNGALLLMEGNPTLNLGQIIVYGQKRAQTLDDVNASVAIYDNDFVSGTTFTDVSQLYQFTPNVQAAQADEGDFAIRGINFRGETGSEGALLGSYYVDGIFQSVLGVEAGPLSIWDVEQVEIYRGVQSTIQGRNALAGTIQVRTADPTYEWTLKSRAEVARANTRRLSIAGGGPIIDDQLAFRVAIDDFESDGFLSNPVAGIDDLNFDDTRDMRFKLLVEPKAIEGLSVLYTYIESDGFAGTGFGTNVANGPDFFARESTATDPTLLETETENHALKLSYDFQNDLTLEFVYTKSDAFEDSGPRFGAFDLSTFFDFATDSEVVDTYELRGIWSGERLNLIGGLYYFEQEQETSRSLFTNTLPVWFEILTTEKIENQAIFFDGEYELLDNWYMLFGARYDREETEQSGYNARSFAGPIDTAALARNSAKTEFSAFLPKLGVRWDQSENVSWSFTFQRGYRAGAPALDSDNTPYEFDPEFTDNYELALRSTLFDGRMTLNANVFFIEWSDQQVTSEPIPTVFRVDNAGSSELYGAEVDLTASLTDNLTLLTGIGLLHTEFKEFRNAQTDSDFSGNAFRQAPEFSANFGLFYEHGNGVFATFDGRYQSSSYSDSENIEEHKLDSHFVANAKLGYRQEHWSAAIFVRNLFDENYLSRVRFVDGNLNAPQLWQASVGDPRVVGAELMVNF